MKSFEKIKEFVDLIDLNSHKYSREDELTIRAIASQLGYSWPNCNCNLLDKLKDLVIKIKLFVRNHPEGFSHYVMSPGIVRIAEDGVYVTNNNLTDAYAEEFLAKYADASTYIKRILPAETVETVETADTVKTVKKPVRKSRKTRKEVSE